MTVLTARLTALRERLARIDQMSVKVAEAGALEDLRSELTRRIDKLGPALATQVLLTRADIPAPSPTSANDLRTRAADVLRKFRAEPTSATLKRGHFWQNLLRQIDTAGGDFSASVVDSWRAYRGRVFAGEAPAAIRNRLAPTQSNEDAFERYRGLHQRLQAAFQQLPQDAASIEQVKRLAQQLETAAQGFNFDVPAAVKTFLEAVQTVAGAPLDLLTPDVVDWLKANNSYEAYRISAKGRA
jgi:hypothetical protein